MVFKETEETRRKKMFRILQDFLKILLTFLSWNIWISWLFFWLMHWIQGVPNGSLIQNLSTYRGGAALERMVLPLQVKGRPNTKRTNGWKRNRTFLAFLLRIWLFDLTRSCLESAEMRAGAGPSCAAWLCRPSERAVSHLQSRVSISESCRSCDSSLLVIN